MQLETEYSINSWPSQRNTSSPKATLHRSCSRAWMRRERRGFWKIPRAHRSAQARGQRGERRLWGI